MPDALKRLVGPAALANAAATVYTVPAATTAVMRCLRVVNEGATSATFTVSIGTDGAGKRIFYAQAVTPGDSFDWTGNIVLTATEVLQAYASAATTLTLTISGVEST